MTRAAGKCFPTVKQHPKCMDHAILHGKPFGFLKITTVNLRVLTNEILCFIIVIIKHYLLSSPERADSQISLM